MSLHRFAVVLMWVLAVIVAVACSRDDRAGGVSKGSSADAEAARPNVVVICIDVLRADHLGAYGRARATTPWIDRLARESVVFDRVVSPASWTKPSVPSYFTARFPHQHGVYEGSRSEGGRLVSDVLPEEETTFAEVFSAGGYRTVAFVNNAQIDGVLGFAQGFDLYADDCGDAVDIRARFLGWLADEKEAGDVHDEPFCAYLHFLDIHWPYTPAEPYRTMFETATASIDFFTPAWKTLKRNIREGVIELSEADRQSMIDLYDAELRFTDAEIGRVLAGLREFGHEENTIVVLLSDHGEEFLDHGGIGHGNGLFGELIDVPMTFRLPRRQHAGVRVQAPVSTVDLLPTLADLCDLESPRGIAGISLVPYVEIAAAGGDGSELERRLPVYSEGLHGDRYHQSIVHDGWKYIAEIYLGDIGDDGEEEPDVPDARDALAPGVRIEVEGILADESVFLAEEVIVQEDQDDDRDKVTGTIESIEADRSAMTLLGFRVPLDEETDVENEGDEDLDVDALDAGTYVKVYGKVTGGTFVHVDKIKLRGPNRRPKTKLEGAIRRVPTRDGKAWTVRVADRDVRIDGGTEVMTQAWERVLDERKNKDDSKTPAATATRDPLAIAQELGIPVRHSLYDLRSDPAETVDLSSRRPDRVDELRRRLESFRVVSERARSGRMLESSDEERLRALGYIK